jgi:hypothetical protein
MQASTPSSLVSERCAVREPDTEIWHSATIHSALHRLPHTTDQAYSQLVCRAVFDDWLDHEPDSVFTTLSNIE